RGDRRPWSPAAVAARARARVPADQPDLLQLLREHVRAPTLPLREPARALRPLGCGHRSDQARCARAAAARAQLRAMSRRTLLLVAAGGAAAGIVLRIWAVLLPQGALDADEAVVGLMTHKIIHGTLP